MAIKRCKSSFAASVRGVPRVMKVGQLVNDDDPILKGREHLFEDVEAAVRDTSVEDASAAPGRRRTLTRAASKRTQGKPAKKATPKAAPKAEPKQQETEQAASQGADGTQEGTAS